MGTLASRVAASVQVEDCRSLRSVNNVGIQDEGTLPSFLTLSNGRAWTQNISQKASEI